MPWRNARGSGSRSRSRIKRYQRRQYRRKLSRHLRSMMAMQPGSWSNIRPAKGLSSPTTRKRKPFLRMSTRPIRSRQRRKIISKLAQIEFDIRSVFYNGDPKGNERHWFYKKYGSERRRRRRVKVLKALNVVIEELELDNALMIQEGHY